MASRYSINVTAGDGTNPFIASDTRGNLRRLKGEFNRLQVGSRNTIYTLDCRTSAAQATGTITMASSSGTVGAIINGVTITVTWATSDTASSVALAAAINASSNALVQNLVTATSALGVTTITSTVPGVVGNTMTLAATGTNVTASAARLTGGTETVITMVVG